MSGRVNIPSTIQDPAYRYTMPRMVLKQESRLNGVKTNIVNLSDVGHALRVPDSAILKYFCAEVGANSEGVSIVKGQHAQEALALLLDKFIARYVLCSKCKYPELAYTIEKKNLSAKCNACGGLRSLDTSHKAGKQMFKEIPTFYAANPEFKGKTGKSSAIVEDAQKAQKKAKKKKAKEGEEENEEQKIEEAAKKKREKIIENGGEINVLDAVQLKLDSPEIEQLIKNIDTLVSETDMSVDDLLEKVRVMQISLNVTPDYKYYILFCGLFNQNRNIVKHWSAYEKAFLTLVGSEGAQTGVKHLFQTIILYFIRRDESQQKFIPTFFKLMYDNSVFSNEFILNWHGEKQRLDKKCILYDKKAEKLMRPQLDSFIEWLSQEYDEEEYDEEEETKDAAETEEVAVQEDDETRRQRELVEVQRAAQRKREEQLKQAAKESASNPIIEESKAEAVPEINTSGKNKSVKVEIGQVENKTNIANVAIEDEFDIDDI